MGGNGMSSIKPSNNIELVNILKDLKNDIFKTLCCVKVGIIQEYDVATQTSSIEIGGKWHNPYTDVWESYPILTQVPTQTLGGASYIHCPINKGDECLVLFNDFMIDNWYRTGESQPTQFFRFHDISDGFAIVGVRSLPKSIQNLLNVIVLFFSENSNITLDDSGCNIKTPSTNITGTLTVQKAIVGNSTTTSELHSTHGASGSFSNAAGQTLTIVDGIITAIS